MAGSELRMSKSIGDALFTKTQRKILALLFVHSDDTFYLNEIVRRAGMGKGTIARELENLRAAGIITAVKVGNQNRYRANADCPVYDELKSLVRKTFGLAEEIAGALDEFSSRISCAFIYGSLAKGEEKPGSDLDLMIIGENIAYTDVMNALLESETNLGRTINPTVYAAAEFNSKRKQEDSFLSRVLAQPLIPVMGSLDDL